MIDVKKTYRDGQREVTALGGVTLHVPRGSVYGIVGESGAGKSTLIRCLNLLERPDSGTVRVDGLDLLTLSASGLRQARRRIGMIFQHFNLFSSRTVVGNVMFPLECAGVPGREARRKALAMLDVVGLADKAEVHPAQLSGGQKQRVGIARALVGEPAVLLSDEATSALDPVNTAAILDLLQSLSRQMGLTVVLITHEMAVVKAACDHVALLEHGRVVEEGPVLDLASRPGSRLAAQLFHSYGGGYGGAGAAPPAAAGVEPAVGPGVEARRRVAVVFVGSAAGQPLLTRTARQYGVNFNILEGGIERVGGAVLGRLVVEAVADDGPRLEQALTALREAGCRVEVLDVA